MDETWAGDTNLPIEPTNVSTVGLAVKKIPRLAATSWFDSGFKNHLLLTRNHSLKRAKNISNKLVDLFTLVDIDAEEGVMHSHNLMNTLEHTTLIAISQTIEHLL